jgi:hypothetical protein
MGQGEWTRHVIINTQPKDDAARASAEWLERKPTRNQEQQRWRIDFDDRFQLESKQTDKVYVVGHGDKDKQKLGGHAPEDLAAKLKEGVQNCQQVNVMMCGTSDLELARRFATRLFREGYAGKVYAYGTPMAVDLAGKKHAVVNDPEMAKLVGVECHKEVPKVIAAFEKESFAEEFAEERGQDKGLLEFLHGGGESSLLEK